MLSLERLLGSKLQQIIHLILKERRRFFFWKGYLGYPRKAGQA